jgi:hypothetical protein
VPVRPVVEALVSTALSAKKLVVVASYEARNDVVVVASVVVPETKNEPLIAWFPRSVVVPIVSESIYA